MPGTLFVVATPIGNLEDLSFRALRTLKEVGLIVAEDTRRTAKLLTHYGVSKPLVSLHAHNEVRTIPGLIARLDAGESIALVSDAGTPGIADPGEHLVRSAHERGLRVSPVPGPSSIAAALSVSGFPADEFVFMGFVPRSGADRQDWLRRLAREGRTTVFFEVPHRIDRTLKDLESLLVNRPIMIHRELTKIHESLTLWPNKYPERSQGEFVLVVGPQAPTAADISLEGSQPDSIQLAARIVDALTSRGDFDRRSALMLAARAVGEDHSKLSNKIKKSTILAKRQKWRLP